MSSVANLLSKGNGKLGENIHHWSIPAVETCPGRSGICETHCYARSGRYRTDIIRDRLTGSARKTDCGTCRHCWN
jgi:hypothetical protein